MLPIGSVRVVPLSARVASVEYEELNIYVLVPCVWVVKVFLCFAPST